MKYIDYEILLPAVKEIVRKKLNSPGRCLGYRALALKIRQEHGFNVPRDLIYDIMYELEPHLLKERTPGMKKNQR